MIKEKFRNQSYRPSGYEIFPKGWYSTGTALFRGYFGDS